MSLYRDLKNGVRLVRDGLACAMVPSAPRNECAVIRMDDPDDAAKDGMLPPECIFSTMECFGCNWKCMYRVKSGAAVPCIEQIGIERVWQAVESSFSHQ